MLTIGFIAIVFALLALVGVFALIAKEQRRQGQSGSQSAAGSGKEGRVTGHH
jgi:hypothetical protein